MATAAKIGHGSKFLIGPTPYTEVAEVLSISGPSLSRDAVEATHLASPEGWREYLGGLKDGGEVTLELNWIPSEAEKFEAEFDKADPGDYRIELPFNPVKTWDFKAICTGWEAEAPMDDRITATVTFKISGKPTLS